MQSKFLIAALAGCLALAAGCAKQAEQPTEPAIIDLAKFNTLKEGMTYEEVTKVVGQPGKLPGDSREPGKGMVIAQWPNGDGSSANLTFSDGKLFSKQQTGLK